VTQRVLITRLLTYYLLIYLLNYLHLTTTPFSRVGGLLYERQLQNHAVGLWRYCYAICSADAF